MYNEFKTSYIYTDSNKLKKLYLYNNQSITKKELLQHIKNLVYNNNVLYYKELKNYNFDYIKQYKNGCYYLLEYKSVKNDILNNGLIYTFKVNLL